MEEEPEAARRYDGSREVRSPSRKLGHKGKGKGNNKCKGLPDREAGGKGAKKGKDKDRHAKKGPRSIGSSRGSSARRSALQAVAEKRLHRPSSREALITVRWHGWGPRTAEWRWEGGSLRVRWHRMRTSSGSFFATMEPCAA